MHCSLYSKKHALCILHLVSLLLLVSCGPRGNAFRIKGSFEDMKEGELYIYNLSETHARFDTLNIKEGNFFYGGTIDEVTPFIIVFPNSVEQVIFVGPGEEAIYEASATDLKGYAVKGNAVNKLYRQFRDEIAGMGYSETLSTAKKYIREHAESVCALYLFDRYLLQDPESSIDDVQEMLSILKQANAGNRYLLNLESTIANTLSSGVGKSLPDATAENRNHDTVKLWSKSSDWTILYFWATWADNYYNDLMRLREISNVHKGKMRIAAISFDNESATWENITSLDSTNIDHYIQTSNWESDIAKKYSIHYIPSYILVDSNHKVKSRGQKIEQLDRDIDRLVKY